MPLLLKIGTFDVSRYVRLQPGEGFDAVSQQHLQPAWGSGIDDGSVFLGLDVANKEFVAPLIIGNTGTTSPDALASLRAALQMALRPGARIEMREESSTRSTWWTLQFGRWEEDYTYRLSQAGGAKGRLRMWTSPYGDLGADRVAATGAATGPALTLPIASAGGDAPALIAADISTNDDGAPAGRFVALAALPHPSYRVQHSASWIVSGASGAVASRLSDTLELRLDPVVYAGRHRLLAMSRSTQWPPPIVSAIDDGGEPVGTALATSRDWSLVDLGVVSIPTAAALSSAYRVVVSASQPRVVSTLALFVGSGGQITAAYLLPEDSTSYWIDRPRPRASDDFTPGSGPLVGRVDVLGNRWLTPPDPGSATLMAATRPFAASTSGLQLYNSPYAPLAAGVVAPSTAGVLQGAGVGATTSDRGWHIKTRMFINAPDVASTLIRISVPQFLSGSGAVGAGEGVRLELGPRPALRGFQSVVQNTATIVASTITRGWYELELHGQGNLIDFQSWAVFRPAVPIPGAGAFGALTLSDGTIVPYASVAISGRLDAMAVEIAMYCPTVPADPHRAPVLLDAFELLDYGGSAPAPGDSYAVNAMRSAERRLTSSGAVSRYVDGGRRGRFPTLQPPSAAAIAVISHPLGAGGAGNVQTTAKITVRDRFHFVA